MSKQYTMGHGPSDVFRSQRVQLRIVLQQALRSLVELSGSWRWQPAERWTASGALVGGGQRPLPGRRRRGGRAAASRRLRAEALEDRRLLSASRLFLPLDLAGSPGSTITVPVNLEVTEPGGVSLAAVTMALAYDPAKFTASNFRLGSLIDDAGYGFSTLVAGATLNLDPAGAVRLTTSTAMATPLIPVGTTAAVIEFDLTIAADASSGQFPVNLLINYETTATEIADGNAAAIELWPPPTNSASDAVDGIITVLASPATLTVTGLTPTSSGFEIVFSRPVAAEALNLYYGVDAALGPADVELRDGSGNLVRGSLVIGDGAQTAAFIRTGGPLATGDYAVQLRSAVDGFQDVLGELLDGNADGTPGDPYAGWFTVADPPAGSVVIGIPDFSRGPGQPVNVPGSESDGIPLTLSDGAGVQDIDLRLAYDPELLEITGASASAGAQLTLTQEGPGQVRLEFHAPAPLPAGATVFAHLVANVLPTASYAAMHVLDLRQVLVDAGATPAIEDDGVHLVAYFGDATGNGTYSSLDTSRVSRVVVGLDNGFSAYPLADPLLVGDLTGNGNFSSLDTSWISRVIVGLPVAEVPPLPGPAPQTSVSGGDALQSVSPDLNDLHHLNASASTGLLPLPLAQTSRESSASANRLYGAVETWLPVDHLDPDSVRAGRGQAADVAGRARPKTADAAEIVALDLAILLGDLDQLDRLVSELAHARLASD